MAAHRKITPPAGKLALYPAAHRKSRPRPEKQAYFWPSSAQSMRSEPFVVARAAAFEKLAGVFAVCGAE